MNLLDKYVAEVGKHLPRKTRADIETEIRSILQDMLEDRSEQTGKPVDEALTAEVLKEYGSPAKVAESYRGAQYLIGPRLFPIFELITKIVITALLGAGLLGYTFSGVLTKSFAGPEFFSFLWKFWTGFLGGMISAFGNLVIVFAILERVLPASEFEKETEEWDPAELAKEPDPDHVSYAESIFAIIFTLIGLAIFNLVPEVVGFSIFSDGKWTFIPALSDAFFKYMPYINFLGLAQIALHIFLLREGNWRSFTRIANIVLEIAGIVLAGVMLAGPSLINVTAEKLAQSPLAEAASLVPFFNWVPVLALTIVIVISSIEVAQAIYKLIKGKPAPFIPAK